MILVWGASRALLDKKANKEIKVCTIFNNRALRLCSFEKDSEERSTQITGTRILWWTKRDNNRETVPTFFQSKNPIWSFFDVCNWGVGLGWGWGLHALAHSFATKLWPRVTCLKKNLCCYLYSLVGAMVLNSDTFCHFLRHLFLDKEMILEMSDNCIWSQIWWFNLPKNQLAKMHRGKAPTLIA